MRYSNLYSIALIYRRVLTSTNQKALRQKWPYTAPTKEVSGKPIHLYPLETLPDDVQTAWAEWNQEKYKAVLEEEKSKQEGRPNRVPLPITLEEAKEVLTWPIRKTYYQKDHPGMPKRKIYDGFSTGLCPKARQILINHFGNQLKSIPEAAPQPERPPISAQSQSKPSVVTVAEASYTITSETPQTIVQAVAVRQQTCLKCGQPHNLVTSLEEKERIIAEKDEVIAQKDKMIAFVNKRFEVAEQYLNKYEKKAEDLQIELDELKERPLIESHLKQKPSPLKKPIRLVDEDPVARQTCLEMLQNDRLTVINILLLMTYTATDFEDINKSTGIEIGFLKKQQGRGLGTVYSTKHSGKLILFFRKQVYINKPNHEPQTQLG